MTTVRGFAAVLILTMNLSTKIKYIENMNDRIDVYTIQILCKAYYKKINNMAYKKLILIIKI